ncbi:tetratricopeptide repeat protein [Ancylostoma duodenale]|uniref:Tetratricopeptide repeat protein n=1 Tax=Ancylostoma duodenale TaxID=51022 RepID=A0A0C2GBT2_9BILA|nr:tetratricopeptide repeat protein [Ancylostoma duodenale]
MLRYDAKLPALLPSPSMHQIRKGLSLFPPPRQSHNLCSGVKKLSILLENQVSTWVSVTAKGEDIAKYVDLRGPVPGVAGLQPALKSLGNERDSIEHVAARLHTALVANGMGKNGQTVSWLLCVLSSLYWRVVGDAQKAVGCLQCALQTAPQHTRDVALVSLANICHQAGLLHSALIAAGTALSASPNLVAIHFTIANIYASMGDYQRALEFYYSTLSLQMNFEPAKERIRAIYCHSGKKFDFQAV